MLAAPGGEPTSPCQAGGKGLWGRRVRALGLDCRAFGLDFKVEGSRCNT